MLPEGSAVNGFVTLAGAGPGDADLLTLGTLKALQSAQALLYDALVSEDIIAMAPQRCIKICVGKRGDRLSVSQDKTNALMVRLARRGLHVVRLKGGDPSMFGRVEEERQHLDRHGIAHKTLAGVTAASAAAAQFAFPLTHRGEARSVMFLTGRTLDGKFAETCQKSAETCTNLVVYMASHCAESLQNSLISAGKDSKTAVVLIENAGRPQARAVSTNLGNLAAEIAAAAWDGPVLIGIGDAFRYARINAQTLAQQAFA